MLTKALIAAAIALPIATGAFALDQGTGVGTDKQRIESVLKAHGYTVREIEIEQEDGKTEIEAYAEKDGKLFEIEIDAATGKVVDIEEDDDKDDTD